MKGKVIGGSLRLRSSMSTSAAIVTSIPDGSTVEVNLCGNQQWFRATYSVYSGYVMSQFIYVTGGGTFGTITTSTDPLNIRALPSTSATILFKAPKGMPVKILETSNGFYRISCSLGTGWGSTQYITPGGDGGDGDSDSGFHVGNFCKVTKNSVKVYSDVKRTNHIGYVHKDAKFIVKSITKDSSGDYYSIGIQWGGANSSTRYIRSDCLADSFKAASSSWARALTVAEGFAKSCANNSATSGDYRYTGDTLEIPASGGWCQRFCCFICKAAQVDSSMYPAFEDSYCSQGVSFFRNGNKGAFYEEKSVTPQPGDWLYIGTGPNHVVFVYDTDGDTLHIVEGNNTQHTLGARTINFATATNIYGVAHPYYE